MITKNLLKKVALLACAGVLFFDGLAMAGCASEEEEVKDSLQAEVQQTLGSQERVYSKLLADDMFVLVDNVLHKGDVFATYYYPMDGAAGFGVTTLKLDCDEYIMTNDFKAYKKNEPKQELYEAKCERCFGE